MSQSRIEVRPIRQLTGTAEFNEVFFDGARTAADLVVGEVGEGWRVAMATLGFERGAAMLGHQIRFQRELADLVGVARVNGAIDDPAIREKLTRAWVGLEVIRAYTLSEGGPQPNVAKLLWGRWHRGLGELAMEVIGAPSMLAGEGYELDEWQRLYLFSRAETIYGGSDEIQRNIIAQRILGLPK